jgi:alkylated DNA repair dioxygenase AlkB
MISRDELFLSCHKCLACFYVPVIVETLFPVEAGWPDGFFYYSHFISNDEEKILHDEILKIPLHPLIFQGYEAKRKVASFGHDWNFQTRTLSKGKDIPHSFQFIIEKVAKKISIPAERLGELLITEYPVGSVINWHRDAAPFDVIAGISLLTACIFRFRPYEKSKQNRKAIISVPLQPRSLYVISGKARADWEHSIPALKQIRYSITVRTLK